MKGRVRGNMPLNLADIQNMNLEEFAKEEEEKKGIKSNLKRKSIGLIFTRLGCFGDGGAS